MQNPMQYHAGVFFPLPSVVSPDRGKKFFMLDGLRTINPYICEGINGGANMSCSDNLFCCMIRNHIHMREVLYGEDDFTLRSAAKM